MLGRLGRLCLSETIYIRRWSDCIEVWKMCEAEKENLIDIHMGSVLLRGNWSNSDNVVYTSMVDSLFFLLPLVVSLFGQWALRQWAFLGSEPFSSEPPFVKNHLNWCHLNRFYILRTFSIFFWFWGFQSHIWCSLCDLFCVCIFMLYLFYLILLFILVLWKN